MTYTLALAYLCLELVPYLLQPILESGFSESSIKETLLKLAFLAGCIALATVYERTSVDHLPKYRRAFVNAQLCVGGLAIIATYPLARLDPLLAGVAIVVGAAFLVSARMWAGQAPRGLLARDGRRVVEFPPGRAPMRLWDE
ncbi:MAG: hypothetical protein JNM90_00755 [Burkholderiales bacterium]|nr:hypothetical protein [Burkholderiales bacterium]